MYVSGSSTAFNRPQPNHTIGDISSLELLVAKLDSSGNPVYVTAIGGTGQAELALDSSGNLYAYGSASASSFATTPGAFNGSAYVTSGDFVCKLRAADGTILFCSLPGTGGYESGGFTTDPLGNVYFAEFPLIRYPDPTEGALALGKRSVQVTKLDHVGAIVYRAEFSGPMGAAEARSIAADAQGNVWVAGRATADFPTTSNALHPVFSQQFPGFLAELNALGTALLYSTFTDNSGYGAQIAIDSSGYIYESDSATDGVVTSLWKYNPGATTLLYRRDFSGLLTSSLLRFAVDANGIVTALATTNAVNFPTYKPVVRQNSVRR